MTSDVEPGKSWVYWTMIWVCLVALYMVVWTVFRLGGFSTDSAEWRMTDSFPTQEYDYSVPQIQRGVP